MGQTRKRHYDRYTLEFKRQAVKLANHPKVMSKDIAESFGIHPVMLYRWQMEYRNGELKENQHMKSTKQSPKRRKSSNPDSTLEQQAELAKANKRIHDLERALKHREDEIDLLKKARRFFETRKQ